MSDPQSVRTEILNTLQEVTNVQLDPERVADSDTLINLGLDSMKVLEFIILLEERFGIEFAEEDLLPENFEHLGALVSYVHGRL